MLTDLFYPDSVFWIILRAIGAGLLGFYGVGWLQVRRMRKLFPKIPLDELVIEFVVPKFPYEGRPEGPLRLAADDPSIGTTEERR